MKTTILSLLMTLLLFSCDPNANKKIGRSDMFKNTYQENSGGGTGSGSGSGMSAGNNTTDAPIDGGLSILLLAGAAYGAKRTFRNRKENKAEVDK